MSRVHTVRAAMNSSLVQALHPGPLDIVGDIHGEIAALRELLRVLGYDEGGLHPQGRRLVFVGDLTDRGPDSPAVMAWAADLVTKGLAQCVLGNHELNLLRQVPKDGNGWFFEDDHDRRKGRFLDSRPLRPTARVPIIEFLGILPLALERNDLRIVHAAWHSASIETVRASALGTLGLYQHFHDRAVTLGLDMGLVDREHAEREHWGARLQEPNASVPLLPASAALDALYQDLNPIRILTSGLERVACNPFFASGKWRMVNRFPWWEEYAEDKPVVIGHYWRWPTAAASRAYSKGEPDLFQKVAPNEWLGMKRNVFCIDFAVGARYKERAMNCGDRFDCRLGAVRWPERELMLEDGTRMELV